MKLHQKASAHFEDLDEKICGLKKNHKNRKKFCPSNILYYVYGNWLETLF